MSNGIHKARQVMTWKFVTEHANPLLKGSFHFCRQSRIGPLIRQECSLHQASRKRWCTTKRRTYDITCALTVFGALSYPGWSLGRAATYDCLGCEYYWSYMAEHAYTKVADCQSSPAQRTRPCHQKLLCWSPGVGLLELLTMDILRSNTEDKIQKSARNWLDRRIHRARESHSGHYSSNHERCDCICCRLEFPMRYTDVPYLLTDIEVQFASQSSSQP